MRHLRFKNALQAALSQGFRAKTVKVKFVASFIERSEKRNALNVVPVVVRHKNVSFNRFAIRSPGPAVAEHAQSRAAIQNKAAAVWRDQLNAGSVSAVTP